MGGLKTRFEDMIPPVVTAATLTAFYSVSSNSDPIARARHQARVHDYNAWRACLPADYTSDEPRDWTEYAATVTRSTGHTKGFIADHLDALYSLDQLPSLRQLVEELHHLEKRHLRFISSALLSTPCDLSHNPAFWEIVDEELTDLFTATKPHQLLPDNRAISLKVNGLVRVLHTPEAEPEDPQPEDPETSEPDPPAIDFWSIPDLRAPPGLSSRSPRPRALWSTRPFGHRQKRRIIPKLKQ